MPGDSDFPLQSLADKLTAMDYHRPIGVGIFNDDIAKGEQETLAEDAMAALDKLFGSSRS